MTLWLNIETMSNAFLILFTIFFWLLFTFECYYNVHYNNVNNTM